MLLFQIIILSFLPSFIFVTFNTSSQALGLLMASLMLILVNIQLFKYLYIKKNILLVLISIIAILYISVMYSLVNYLEFKPIISFFIFLITCISAFSMALRFSLYKVDYIASQISIFLIIMIGLFLLQNTFPISGLNYSTHEKYIFPYSEASHYALTFSYFLIVYSFIGKTLNIFIFSLTLMLFSFYIENMTMMIGSVLSMFSILLRMRNIYFFIFAIVFIGLLIVGFYYISEYEYFRSRLEFENSSNLSVLVYIQGFELAYNNLMKNFGMGLGFQMLGLNSTSFSETTYLIQAMHEGDSGLNTLDGGFLGAKIVAEFGFLGILMIVIYVLFSMKFMLKYQRHYNGDSNKDVQSYNSAIATYFLSHSLIYATIIEVFVRGYGYFSNGVFFLLVGVFYILMSKRNLSVR